ncbi:hypothetical protein [Streptomyces sp. NPDC020597]
MGAPGTFRGGLTTKIHLAADEVYSSPAIREHLRERGIRGVMP